MEKKIVFLALVGFEHYYYEVIECFDLPYFVCFDWSFEAVMKAEPSVVVSVHSIPAALQTLVPALTERGVRTVGLQDGVIEWRHTFVNAKSPGAANRFRPVFYEFVIVFGPLWKRIIEMWGNAGKCVVLGCPRWDSLPSRTYRDYRVGTLKESGKKGQVLVASAKTPYFDDQQEEIVLEAYRDVLRALAARDDVEVTWRVAEGIGEKLGIGARNELAACRT